MVGKQGSDKASVEARQDSVLKYKIRQAKPYQIAQALNISLRTVQRDLNEINQSIIVEVARSRIRPIKLALLEIEERERELWKLYDESPPKPKKQGQEPRDNKFVKLAVMDRLITIYREKNKLLALDHPETAVQSQEEEMPLDEYEEIREKMEKRAQKPNPEG